MLTYSADPVMNVVEAWADCETGRIYLVEYEDHCDPVALGVHGNLARRVDNLLARAVDVNRDVAFNEVRSELVRLGYIKEDERLI